MGGNNHKFVIFSEMEGTVLCVVDLWGLPIPTPVNKGSWKQYVYVLFYVLCDILLALME